MNKDNQDKFDENENPTNDTECEATNEATQSESPIEKIEINMQESNCPKPLSSLDINTDGRVPYDWKSGYKDDVAKRKIKRDAIYLFCVLMATLFLLVLNFITYFNGYFSAYGDNAKLIYLLANFAIAGMLGGVVYGIKYFYRVVARGFWTEDRVYWRIFSPFIALCIGLIIGCMVFAGLLDGKNVNSSAWSIAVGFFSGYFADLAVGKMYEVAVVIFGRGDSARKE